MDQFVAYMKSTLHVDADVSVYESADKLPLYLRNGYDFSLLTVHDTRFLLVQPKTQSNLTNMRKQIGQINNLTGFDCVLCLDNVRVYTKEKMLSEGIPFIISGQQIFMPFLGIALAKNGIREIPYTERLSFSSQKLLLTAIYQDWTQMTLTEAAYALSVSKMTITRSFDELQALGLNFINTEGRTRRFIWKNGRRSLWDTIRPYLRYPVAKQYMTSEQPMLSSCKLGGMSAICHYSMLADDLVQVVAISKTEARDLELSNLPLIPNGESPDMIVQIMSYNIEYQDSVAIDPLTAILSLSENDNKDPRVASAIDEILEACLHD